MQKPVNLAAYRRQRRLDDDTARGRRPLYIDYKDGKYRGTADTRMAEIKSDLEVIDRLLRELEQLT